MGSSAAVVHLFPVSMCSAFRDARLHAFVVSSGYLSYWCLLEMVTCENPSTSAFSKIFSAVCLEPIPTITPHPKPQQLKNIHHCLPHPNSAPTLDKCAVLLAGLGSFLVRVCNDITL